MVLGGMEMKIQRTRFTPILREVTIQPANAAKYLMSFVSGCLMVALCIFVGRNFYFITENRAKTTIH